MPTAEPTPDIATSDDTLLLERIGPVTVLTLNRPDSLNALDAALMRDLRRTVEEIAGDESVRCLVVTGAGKGFCAGGDRKAISAAYEARPGAAAAPEPRPAPRPATDPAEETERRIGWIRRSGEAAKLLHDMPKPVIAMVNGACAGAGLAIASACDMRFGAESAKFTTGFALMGLSGDYGGGWFLSRILGTAKTRQLYMLSERMTAREALAFGLVDRVFADAELRERTLEVADRLAAMPASGLAYVKANLGAAFELPLDAFLEHEARSQVMARNAITKARKAAQA